MSGKNISREVLILKAQRLAGLPPSKSTIGYFTKEQLMKLVLFLEQVEEERNRAGNIES